MKIKKSRIVVFLGLFIGVALVLYPTISNFINSYTQSKSIGVYEKEFKNLSNEDYDKILNSAKKYNKKLLNKKGGRFKLSEAEFKEYNSLLRIKNVDVMAILEIPKIDSKFSVYHSVSEEVLQVAIGHIPGSSLPIGGKGTHAVFSGHNGLPSAKLFTDIVKLEEGDILKVYLLDKEFTYKVDRKKIVLPDTDGFLEIEKDKDYVTLVTCTPYGVNTHRLLIRAKRIDNVIKNDISPNAILIDRIIVWVCIFIFILFVFIFMKFIIKIFQKIIINKSIKEKEMVNNINV